MRQINFCPDCGQRTEIRIPADDNRPRAICTACQSIHYQNPKIVAGTLPVWKDKVLLCKRAIEPRYGTWTLPAGFMENEETVPEGAMRETVEEADAQVEQLELYTVFSIPHISQIYMMFRAQLPGPNAFGVGPESLESALFSEDEIPWDEISFPMIRKTLEHYFADRKIGQFPLHVSTIEKRQKNQ